MIGFIASLFTIRINCNSSTRVEAGSNTSTVTLRVVGGGEKEVSKLRQ
jgi:hypothetical protein